MRILLIITAFDPKIIGHLFITIIPMFSTIMVSFHFIGIVIQTLFVAPANTIEVFRTDSYSTGFFGLIFFAGFFSFWVCYNSTFPILIASTRKAFNSKSRGGDWKKLIVSLLIITIIALPLYILSVDNYGYVTDEKLSYNPYFSISEQDYNYDDITEVTTSFSVSDDEERLHLSYIVTDKSGQSLDVAEGGLNIVLLVNGFLQGKDIAFSKGVIDKAIYEKLIDRCNPETVRMIDICYIIT
jgi:hypothetical protein